MSQPPYLTDDEIEFITRPLKQGAARARYFEKMGCLVKSKPNGQPIVWRSSYEEARTGLTGARSREEILQMAQPFKGIAGVYFLVAAGELVYVGQSDNVYRRVSQHSVVFDSWHYMPVSDRAKRIEVEAIYIRKFSPRLNRQGLCDTTS